jgi:hypothetical protein
MNAWESALPTACRPPPDRPSHLSPGGVLPIFFKHPCLHVLQSKSKICRSRVRHANEGEDRGSTPIFVTAVVWLVYNSRHESTALKPQCEKIDLNTPL